MDVKMTKKYEAIGPDANHNPIASKETAKPLFDYTDADAILSRIGTGKEHAYRLVGVDHNGREARALRRAVSDANHRGDVIINDMDGAGYYRPNLTSPDERAKARAYLNVLRAQAKHINETVAAVSAVLRDTEVEAW